MHGVIDEKRPEKDRVVMRFGPVNVQIWDKDERKALIAALVKVDAQMDARRGEITHKLTDEKWDSLRYEIAEKVWLIVCDNTHLQPSAFYAAQSLAIADAIIKKFKEN